MHPEVDSCFKIERPFRYGVSEDAEKRIVKIEEYLDKIDDLELANRLYQTLVRSFDTLRGLAKSYPDCRLHTDFAPLSFFFTCGPWCGGVIFHGPHDGFGDGGAPTFSTCINATHGWQVHT